MIADLGPQPLRGYVMRDYDDAIAVLRQSWISQGLSQRELAEAMRCSRTELPRWLSGAVEARGRRLFDLAGALGYDLALVPREDGATRADPLCAWPNGVCTCGEPEGHTREDS